MADVREWFGGSTGTVLAVAASPCKPGSSALYFMDLNLAGLRIAEEFKHEPGGVQAMIRQLAGGPSAVNAMSERRGVEYWKRADTNGSMRPFMLEFPNLMHPNS